MTDSPGIWFVYRSHYEGPLSRRVRRLPAPSVLAWFRDKIDEARTSLEPGKVADVDLGGQVYGLESFFLAVKEHTLHTPKTIAALGKMLREHLYVEGGVDNIRLDAHALRVFTDDDEVELAYFFFDDEAAATHASTLSFLLTTDPALADGSGDAPFSPVTDVALAAPAGNGAGSTYACLFTFYDSESLPGTVRELRGVRLPELAAHLRSTAPDSAWPVELRLLRALIEPGDTKLAPALDRVARFPLVPLAGGRETRSLGLGAQGIAKAEFVDAANGLTQDGDPSKSIIHEAEHVAVLCAHTSAHFGYQQWVLFDDKFAGAHPDLASSIVHAAQSSDPLEAPKTKKKAPVKMKAVADTPPPPAKSPKGGTKIERAWKSAVGQRTEGRAYRTTDRFADGELLSHAKFGLGVVTRVDGTKIEVLFRDCSRVMLQGATA